MQQWIGIMASDPKGVIGDRGGLPWHFPEDLEFFQKTTRGQVMLMGSKTYQSLPDAIKRNRTCIVLTRSVPETTHAKKNLIFIPELACLDQLSFPGQLSYMIGGGVLMGLCLDQGLLSSFILTLMHQSYSGDAFMPLSRLDGWKRVKILSADDYDRFRLDRM